MKAILTSIAVAVVLVTVASTEANATDCSRLRAAIAADGMYQPVRDARHWLFESHQLAEETCRYETPSGLVFSWTNVAYYCGLRLASCVFENPR